MCNKSFIDSIFRLKYIERVCYFGKDKSCLACWTFISKDSKGDCFVMCVFQKSYSLGSSKLSREKRGSIKQPSNEAEGVCVCVINSKGLLWSQMFVSEKELENKMPIGARAFYSSSGISENRFSKDYPFTLIAEHTDYANFQGSLLNLWNLMDGSQMKWCWASFWLFLNQPKSLRVRTIIPFFWTN